MFETLFTRPHVLVAHNLAPCVESRKRFLVHCQERGYPLRSIRKIAWILLVFSKSVDLCRPGQITDEEIAFAVDHRIRLLRSERTQLAASVHPYRYGVAALPGPSGGTASYTRTICSLCRALHRFHARPARTFLCYDFNLP